MKKIISLLSVVLGLSFLSSCNSGTRYISREQFIAEYNTLVKERGEIDSYSLVTSSFKDKDQTYDSLETLLIYRQTEKTLFADYEGNNMIPVSFDDSNALSSFIFVMTGTINPKETFYSDSLSHTMIFDGALLLAESIFVGKAQFTFNNIGLITYFSLDGKFNEDLFSIKDEFTFSDYQKRINLTSLDAFAIEYENTFLNRDKDFYNFGEALYSGLIYANNNEETVDDSFTHLTFEDGIIRLHLPGSSLFNVVAGFENITLLKNYFLLNSKNSSFYQTRNGLLAESNFYLSSDETYYVLYCFNNLGLISHVVFEGKINDKFFSYSFNIKNYNVVSKSNLDEFIFCYNEISSLRSEINYHQFVGTCYSRKLDSTVNYETNLHSNSFLLTNKDGSFYSNFLANYLLQGNLALVFKNGSLLKDLLNTITDLLTSYYSTYRISSNLLSCSIVGIYNDPSGVECKAIFSFSFDSEGLLRSFTYTLTFETDGINILFSLNDLFATSYIQGTEITKEEAKTRYANMIQNRLGASPQEINIECRSLNDAKITYYDGVKLSINQDDFSINIGEPWTHYNFFYGFTKIDGFISWIENINLSLICSDGIDELYFEVQLLNINCILTYNINGYLSNFEYVDKNNESYYTFLKKH